MDGFLRENTVGVLRAVNANWNGDGWNVNANEVSNPNAWNAGNQVFSRNYNFFSCTTFSSGVDFLGWVNFPRHRVLRTVTKRRMLKNLADNPKPESLQSYLGLLGHGNAYDIIHSCPILIKAGWSD